MTLGNFSVLGDDRHCSFLSHTIGFENIAGVEKILTYWSVRRQNLIFLLFMKIIGILY